MLWLVIWFGSLFLLYSFLHLKVPSFSLFWYMNWFLLGLASLFAISGTTLPFSLGFWTRFSTLIFEMYLEILSCCLHICNSVQYVGMFMESGQDSISIFTMEFRPWHALVSPLTSLGDTTTFSCQIVCNTL